MADDLNLTQYLLENPLYNYGGQLRQQGSQMGPVLSWQEGLARALQGTAGGAFQGLANYQALGERRADQQAVQSATQLMGQGKWDEARSALAARPNTAQYAMQLGMQDAQLKRQLDLLKAQNAISAETGAKIVGALGVGGNPSGDGTTGMPAYQGAIAGNESAGQPNGGYGAVGPTTPMKDGPHKPYGKYQVMDFNIGPWTKEALGKEMTPEEFLQNPQAQDAVFNKKFGQYLNQYGNPQDAASAWFSGQPLRSAGDRPDVLGTTPQSYVQKFSAGLPAPSLGPSGPPQTQGAMPIPNAQPGARPMPIPNAQPGMQPTPVQMPPGFTNYKGMPVHAGTFQMGVASLQAGKIDEGTKLIQKSLEMGASLATDPKLVEVPDPKNPGQTVRVPSWQAVGQQAGHYAAPGSKEGDIAILQGGNPGTPEYRAAYDRLNMPTLGQGGQYIAPPVGSYRPPTFGGAPPATPQVQMSPEGKMKAESDLATEFNKNDAVQKVKTMEPWLTSIDKAMDVPGGYGDMAILQSYYRLMNPGSERPQGPQAAEAYASMGNFPEELKKKIHGVVEGKQFLTPAERSQMREQAYTQFNAFKGAYDRASENVRQRAAAAGLNADAVIGAPLTAESSASPLSAPGGGAQKPQYRMLPSGKLEKVP